MSSLIRDPLRPDGPPLRVRPQSGGPWPADPAEHRRTAPIGAEWDPLCEPWPALNPAPVPAVTESRPEMARPDAHRAPAQPGSSPGSAWGTAARPHAPQTKVAQPTAARASSVTVAANGPARPVRGAIPLALPPEPRPVRDVSPSRLNYRLNRLWLTPAVRHLVRHGLPVLVLVALLAGFWAGEQRRALVMGFFTDLRAAIDARPEFRIDRVEVLTDTPEVAQAVIDRLGVTLPASSLRLDLEDLRARATALDAVAHASVAVRPGGLLEVRLTERVPALVWRHAGGLELLDADGRRVARIASRAVRPDLPLLAGEGAPAAVAEARALLAAAAPIEDRLLGLVRIGERRWDVVLDRDQRILLPASGAVATLERVLALDAAQDLLSRDLVAIDMRNPVRPTLRLTPEASAELARIRNLNTRMANR
jgi:cell division protein FtsQ